MEKRITFIGGKDRFAFLECSELDFYANRGWAYGAWLYRMGK
jgi:hypothetical protein